MATDIRTHDISYVQRKEAEGPVAKKFFGQGEQVEETQDANEGEIFDLSRETGFKKYVCRYPGSVPKKKMIFLICHPD
ncbi:hypothetical protein Tco_0010680 [Tanacetum coccineum]